MVRVNYLALVGAAFAAFLASSLWYSPLLFGKEFLRLSALPVSGPAPLKVAAELARNLVLAYVVARLATLLEVSGWKSGLSLGIWLWIGFPVILLSGSVMWQNAPLALAAIHAGDWLVKLLLMTLIPALWIDVRRRRTGPPSSSTVRKA